ncbi:amino acid adenylation domain-containing protein [Neotabrizicola sp. sgz301269]|uniref:amino acid adenylation domain-containing protein n=1 Tax=Neotabrizicola sp. sgz301269 TaxID=3276282 RepID=UPI00376F63C0
MSDPLRPHLHLLGIGGSGMLPLALLLRQAGHAVSGSDDHCGPGRLAVLEAQGIIVTSAADPAGASAADRVVASPAIPRSHAGLRAARRAGIVVRGRAEELSAVIAGRPAICVAGSHGKSTTTAMLVHVLEAAGRHDVGYMVGADFADPRQPPARLGDAGAPFVLEACEAHGALTAWQPWRAVLTSLDDEHADHYGGIDGLRQAFAAFLARIPARGGLVACGDDPVIADLLRQGKGAALTYGFDDGNDLRAVLTGQARGTVHLRGKRLGELALAVPGQHNLRNALGALGMALQMGIGFDLAAKALGRFSSIARRLQRVQAQAKLRLFDDFAHHPAEVTAALHTLRHSAPGRLIAILEPQLHSRVRRLAPQFAQALALADRSYILPVAELGEAHPDGPADASLARACRAKGLDFMPIADGEALLRDLAGDVKEDDTLVVMAGASGAGLAQRLAASLVPRASGAASLLLGARTPPPPDLATLVARHARQIPAAPAVEMGHRVLSYAALLGRADALCRALRATGVAAGESVGVCLGRSMDRVTAFLACLQLGAVYVPLDPALPEERLAAMLAVAGMRRVIVNAASPALPGSGLTFISCGRLPDPTDDLPPSQPQQQPDGQAAAYMIFTSGTTGQPKAVEVSRGALANYAVAAARRFEIGPGARVSLISGFGFDVSIGDMAMTLAAGACLVCPTDLQAVPGPPVGRFVAEARLTHLSLTPSALAIIPAAPLPHLTHVIVAGEACPPALVDRWVRGRRFLNAYGPTEATVEVLVSPCLPGQPVGIGWPMDNMGACLMTEDLRLAAPGEEGELCLFGAGLAIGYRDQPALTAQRFPTVFLPGLGPTRIYRSGDRARAGADGGFVYLGRMDAQLKVNGHRVEPGEVEAALCDLPDVSEAAVSLIAAGDGRDRLIAHLVLHPGAGAPDPVALRDRLRQRLPSYMVPQHFLPVPDIPRNANGKRDRSALPLPPQLAQPAAARRTGTATEARLMALVDHYAGVGTVTGTRDSLRDAGIDSLSMANLLFAIEDAFAITLDAGFEAGFDTVEVLALMVDAQRAARPASAGGDQAKTLAAQLAPHLASWPGHRFGRAGLMRGLARDAAPSRRSLFWVFQSGQELARLSEALGDALCLYGLRSGHLALDYTPETLAALGRLYADEIASIAPSGPLFLGGNCQGGLVIREAGLELLRQGREVALTILMEQGRFFHYPAETLLIFGAGSYLNPYGQIADPEKLFRTAYPAGHAIKIIPGAHGQYFAPGNVEALAAAILRHLDLPQARPDLPGLPPTPDPAPGVLQRI